MWRNITERFKVVSVVLKQGYLYLKKQNKTVTSCETDWIIHSHKFKTDLRACCSICLKFSKLRTLFSCASPCCHPWLALQFLFIFIKLQSPTYSSQLASSGSSYISLHNKRLIMNKPILGKSHEIWIDTVSIYQSRMIFKATRLAFLVLVALDTEVLTIMEWLWLRRWCRS